MANCDSEKQDKRIANRTFRRKTKRSIKSGGEPPHFINEVSNVYDWGKDGKRYLKYPSPEYIRK
jgi:hypothetical protein